MKYVISILISIFMLSCGGDNSNDTDDQSIVGIWRSNCLLSYEEPESIWSVTEYTIGENLINQSQTNYSDQDCSELYSGGQNLWEGYSGNYIRLSTVQTTSGLDVNLYEVTYNSGPDSEDVVIELGFYVNNDELGVVFEEGGSYIFYGVPYFKQ